ncbi:ABC transporter ATP-binding protein [Zavarzinia sp. CC-PAN008]|uniref:ABC transporter ATP-binding protein n=1 Tax=Zavarzinia sp. CC-PAN008 TaxID=3243332 RepID=UPI003F748D8B
MPRQLPQAVTHDDDQAKAARPATWRRLWPHLKPGRRDIALSAGAALLGAGFGTAVPLVERHIMDHGVMAQDTPLAPWLALLVALAVGWFLVARFRRIRASKVMLDVSFRLRTAIHEHVQRLDLGSHQAMATGQLVARANGDVGMFTRVLSFVPLLLANVATMVGALVAMLVLSPLLAAVTLVLVPLMFVTAQKLRALTFPAAWDMQQKAGDLAQGVDQAVTGARVLRAFAQEEREQARAEGIASDLYASRMRSVRIQARFQPLLRAIPALGQIAALALGGWLALQGTITIGTFLAFSTYLVQLLGPAQMLAGMLSALERARAAFDRIQDLLDTAPEIVDRPGATVLPRQVAGIRFEDVRFAFPGAPPILDGASLDLRAGETMALVGRSGSGKSTMAMLLARFHDVDAGRVTIGGRDVRDVTLASLRQAIGIAFEDSFLFSDSVRANIAFARPDATAAEVEAAARAAEAHDFIAGLPQGYDTAVGERGLNVSGGQRQRIALARALLADPPILVLDDGTSAVDPRVEAAIHATLRRVKQGRTTLLIAHRRSTLMLADRIAVLDQGRIVDCGTHEELEARCPLYRALLAGAATGQGEAAGLIDRPAPAPPLAAPAGRRRRGAVGAMDAPASLRARIAALPPALDRPLAEDAVVDDRVPFTLAGLLWRFRGGLGAAVALVVADMGLSLAGPAFSRHGIDHGVLTGDAAELFQAAGLFAGIVALSLLNAWALTLVGGKVGERLLFTLRLRVFARLLRLGVDFYDREMAGRIMTRMTTDVDAIGTLLQGSLLMSGVNLLSIFGVAAALAWTSPPLAAATALLLVPIAIATLAFRRLSQGPYDEARETLALANATLQESLSGVREAQAFVQEEQRQDDFRVLTRRYVDARMRAQVLIATYFPFLDLVGQLGSALALGLGAVLVAQGDLTPGTLIAFLLYLGFFFSPIAQLSQVLDDWQQARVSRRRLADLMAEPIAAAAPAHPVDPGRLSGAVRFERVSFAYPARPESLALEEFDLAIAPGETVALVGETGAGKSTIVKLLARFHDPVAGRVVVDGHDLRDLDLSAYRRQLGMVPQEPFLFAASIAENITYGRPEAGRDLVERAARAVGAHDFIQRQADGYDHVLGERGRSLSAGQRQLLCLARAELVDPAILLLDEATANLDLASEALVTQGMRRAARGRTTVLIAHRLQTARHADRILVLDRGRIVEQGSHDALLDADGRYAALWRASDTRPAAA